MGEQTENSGALAPATTSRPAADPVVYMSLPWSVSKAARRTVGEVFAKAFDASATVDAGNALRSEERTVSRLKALQDREEPVRFVAGIAPFGLLRSHLPEGRFMTILRDPVERVLAHYRSLSRTRAAE